MRLGIFVTHPIQYQAPVWRYLASDSRISLKVFFFSDHGVTPSTDPGFGARFAWDVPLLDGYHHTFITKLPLSQAYLATIPKLRGFLSQNHFDVVMVHGYSHAHARQLIAARRFGRYKIVLRGEFSDMAAGSQPLWKRAMRSVYLRHLYRSVDAFSSIGTDATEHLVRHGVAAEKISLAKYCVDDEFITTQRLRFDRESARRQLGIPNDQFVVLFSGKLIPRKQPLMLARAIARMPQLDQCTACFVGSGELFEELVAFLRPLMGSRLLAPGFVNQTALAPYFAAADVFVLPTALDTWGLVVNEAMHWGLPCIVSDWAGCARDLIVPGVTGFIHGRHNTQELLQHLTYMQSDRFRTHEMGSAACKHASRFSAACTARALADSFLKVAHLND
jgi:glycosyltransferase involved in cell wall biosynthesis